MDLLIEATIILIGIVLFFTIKNFLPTYFAEKGKNLATKEDIEQITEKVEKIKSEFVKNIEFIKADLSYLNQNKFSIKAAERDALIETNNKYSEWLNFLLNISFFGINSENYELLHDYIKDINTKKLAFNIVQDNLHLFLNDKELMKVKWECVEATLKLDNIILNGIVEIFNHYNYQNLYFDSVSKLDQNISPSFIEEQKKNAQEELDKIFYKLMEDRIAQFDTVHKKRVVFVAALKNRLYTIV